MCNSCSSFVQKVWFWNLAAKLHSTQNMLIVHKSKSRESLLITLRVISYWSSRGFAYNISLFPDGKHLSDPPDNGLHQVALDLGTTRPHVRYGEVKDVLRPSFGTVLHQMAALAVTHGAETVQTGTLH